MKYAELNDAAKEKARQWWKDLVFNDSCDWEAVYEDANTVAALMGITIDKRSFKRVNGSTGYELDIEFDLAYCQGDFAHFSGRYTYAKGSVKAIKDYAPKDEKLHDFAKRLQAVQRRNFYKVFATIRNGRTEAERNDWTSLSREDEKEVQSVITDFGQWIYEQLRTEYEYQTSDEQVIEAIEANDYQFCEHGAIQ